MLILASQSPRRKQLLSLLNLPYEVQSGDVDETPLPDELPAVYVLRLAVSKARAVGNFTTQEAFILAADTTVAANVNGKAVILGKPKDASEAEQFLTLLRGRPHTVLTAIALYHPASGQIWQEITRTTVFMRRYSKAEITSYIASGDPLDKAGAYAIQHAGFHPVAKLEGCYANVMGLPLCAVAKLVAKAGIKVDADIPLICQKQFSATCNDESQYSSINST
ncbi:MAG: Maf family protein [Chloroflexota bacterium]